MVCTCIYCEVIQYIAPNVNKNCCLSLQEVTRTVTATVAERSNNKVLKGLLQYEIHTVTERSPVCDIEILTGLHSLCTGDANLRFQSIFFFNVSLANTELYTSSTVRHVLKRIYRTYPSLVQF
jgi:hypothetical protein